MVTAIATDSTPTLVTFPPSLDCELSRFLLAHYRIPHVEHRHALIFSSFDTLRHGLTPAFPLLYTKSYQLGTVRQIVDHFEARCDGETKLFPQAIARKDIEDDWTLFNQTLAFSTAIFAYYHLLPHRSMMVGPLSDGAPEFEVRAVRAAYPVFAGVLRLLLRLTAARARGSLDQARAIVDAVDARLSDGRRYLTGDAFSLSDMAFAVAAAPIVLPDTYGGPLPTMAEMPQPVRDAVTEVRQHPAGQFALRIYRDHRAGEKAGEEAKRAGSRKGVAAKGPAY
jgi:glutathione S-transferase